MFCLAKEDLCKEEERNHFNLFLFHRLKSGVHETDLEPLKFKKLFISNISSHYSRFFFAFTFKLYFIGWKLGNTFADK